MKNENKLAPNTITNSTPQVATVFSIERVNSENESLRPRRPSRMAPAAPTAAASVGLNTPA